MAKTLVWNGSGTLSVAVMEEQTRRHSAEAGAAAGSSDSVTVESWNVQMAQDGAFPHSWKLWSVGTAMVASIAAIATIGIILRRVERSCIGPSFMSPS